MLADFSGGPPRSSNQVASSEPALPRVAGALLPLNIALRAGSERHDRLSRAHDRRGWNCHARRERRPARTPTFALFAQPDYFVVAGAGNRAASCVAEESSSAWNHGGISPDVNVTWLGLVGPGVHQLGINATIWSDHANIRPTMLEGAVFASQPVDPTQIQSLLDQGTALLARVGALASQ